LSPNIDIENDRGFHQNVLPEALNGGPPLPVARNEQRAEFRDKSQNPKNWVWTGKGFAYPAPIDSGILLIEKSLQREKLLNTVFDWEDINNNRSGGWGFHGFGASYNSCGEFYTTGCLEHNPAFIMRKVNNCRRAECPVCSGAWLAESASKIADRVESAKKYHRQRRPIHLTVSPPLSDWYKPLEPESYSKLRRKASRLLKRVGFQGGVSVFHPYRKKCKICGAGETEYADNCPKCGGNDWGWTYSPHFHYIGYGWIVGVKSMFAQFGWVIKNIGVRDEVFPVAYYILSHAGIRERNHVFTWIGSLSWAHYKREYISEYERPHECPICGSLIQPVRYTGPGVNPFTIKDYDKPFLSYEWEYVKR